MRFHLSSLVLAATLSSAFTTATYAQQAPTACPGPIEEQLKAEISALPGAPNVQSFACEVVGDLASGVSNYIFKNATSGEVITVIFELNHHQGAILLGALYASGQCPAVSCVRGWLNNFFLQTGYGNLPGTWTSIQEDDPDATVQKVVSEARKAFAKRKP